MCSLTAYFSQNRIWLSIIQRNKEIPPPGHSNTVVHVVNSIIGPCNTAVPVVKVPGFSSTVPPSVSNLPRPSSTECHVVNNLPGTSSTVAPVLTASLPPPALLLLLLVQPLWPLQHCFSCC